MLARILVDTFYQTNQNGNSRSKAQSIELFARFPIASLTTDTAEIRITGDTAVVTGSQTERNGTGVDNLLFMRVYVRGVTGWQLQCSGFSTRLPWTCGLRRWFAISCPDGFITERWSRGLAPGNGPEQKHKRRGIKQSRHGEGWRK